MFTIASASQLFMSVMTGIGSEIVYFLSIIIGAWAGFLLLRFGLHWIGRVVGEGNPWGSDRDLEDDEISDQEFRRQTREFDEE